MALRHPTKPKSAPLEMLYQLLICDPIAGTLTWKPRPASMFKTLRDCQTWNDLYAGQETFKTKDAEGYHWGKFNRGAPFRAHRIVWAMTTGSWPKEQIDHINGDKTDNRFANLREATDLQNRRNMKRPHTNKSGVCGVCWHKGDQKWVVQISHAGKRIRLGGFASLSDAASARKAAEIKYGYHPNHGRIAA